ncbi:unnamed protein product [Paramecium sonneborni]|uniref:Uncharacterized protein n=1 Tax=Paramecium sonneborni TaxID=65129 RepID=A0A8S1L562_9CILI|nr:unnamed protein product [Paramecium sonneborni]
MQTLHQKSLTESQIINNNASFSIHQTLRKFNPSKFLNNLEQLDDIQTIQQTHQHNENTQQIQPQTEPFHSRFPKIESNLSQNISKPLNLMPLSKHNQLKSQLANIFSKNHEKSDNHIILPGLHKKRKESQLLIQMIEQQISFPNQDTQTSRTKRFQRKRDQLTEIQTNLDNQNNLLKENSQLDVSNNNHKKVDFHKRVKVINLENGRIATEVIKEEDEQKSPNKSKRKFVSQKTKFYQVDTNP